MIHLLGSRLIKPHSGPTCEKIYSERYFKTIRSLTILKKRKEKKTDVRGSNVMDSSQKKCR